MVPGLETGGSASGPVEAARVRGCLRSGVVDPLRAPGCPRSAAGCRRALGFLRPVEDSAPDQGSRRARSPCSSAEGSRSQALACPWALRVEQLPKGRASGYQALTERWPSAEAGKSASAEVVEEEWALEASRRT